MIGLSPIMAVAGPSMAIPGPYWLFTVLHWLTFTLHLTAMNILFGGLMLLLFSKSNLAKDQLFPAMTKIFPTSMAATITLGVAPLLFLQVIYGKFFYSASIVAGWNWFLIIPVVIVAYYLLYLVSMSKSLGDKMKRRLLCAAVIGFIYVSYTLVLILDLTEKPGLLPELYLMYEGGIAFSPDVGETLFRWLHMAAGAIAVAGVFLQLLSLHHGRLKGNNDLMRYGGRMFMAGVIKAAILGTVYLFMLDGAILKAFMKSAGIHAIATAIVLNIVALVVNFKAVKGNSPQKKIWLSAILVFAGMFTMVVARHYLRLVYLDGHFDPSTLTINPQWSVFAMFLITFVAGLITLYWMIQKYFKSAEAA